MFTGILHHFFQLILFYQLCGAAFREACQNPLKYNLKWDSQTYKIVDATEGIVKCKTPRPEPTQRLLKYPLRFSQENCDLRDQCPAYCHHQEKVEADIIKHRSFSLSVLANYSCVGINHERMRVVSFMNISFDIDCGRKTGGQGLDAQGNQIIYKTSDSTGWVTMLYQDAYSGSSIEVNEFEAVEIKPKRPLERIDFGYWGQEGDRRSLNGDILFADLFVTHRDINLERQYLSQRRQHVPHAECLCEEGSISQTPGRDKCNNGGSRYTSFGYSSLHGRETELYFLLDEPCIITKIEVYASNAKVTFSRYDKDEDTFPLFSTFKQCCKGQLSVWEDTDAEEIQRVIWTADERNPVVTNKLEALIKRENTTPFIYNISLCGRYLDAYEQSGECFCFPGNSESGQCGECNQCECRGGTTINTNKHCRPTLTHLNPRYGPMYGGTTLTIHGHLLNPYPKVSKPKVTLGNYTCQFRFINDSQIICTTISRFPTSRKWLSTVKVKIPVLDVLYEVKPSLKFEYRGNPKIDSIHPCIGFQGRVLTITITGQHLNAAEKPLLEIHPVLDGVHMPMKTGKCFNQNQTRMFCDVQGEDIHYAGNASLLFKFDALSINGSLSRVFKFVEVPDFDSKGLIVYSNANGQSEIKIKKTEKVMCCTNKKDYIITIASKVCQVSSIDKDFVMCKPPKLEGLIPIQVSLYGLEFEAGYIKYEDPDIKYEDPGMGDVLPGIVGSVVTFIVLLAIFVMILLYLKRKIKTATNHEVTMNLHQCEERRDSQDLTPVKPPPGVLDVLDLNLRRIIDTLLLDKRDFHIQGIIGQGNFGTIHRAYQHLDGYAPRLVAAKTITGDREVTTRDLTMFLEEATVMKDFEHPNVLSLIGVVTDGCQVYVILPFMENGDLRSYVSNKVLDNRRLMQSGIDVARGMEYLSELKFVHRDLAARNCMVNGKGNVLVGDFGLAKDIYHADYYKSNDHQQPLPYKWMAPESMERKVFSEQSDVWSYGVLLWELYSRGETPYVGVANPDLLKYIRRGQRLAAPEDCPYFIYRLMTECWTIRPNERPRFSDIVSEMDKFIHLDAEDTISDAEDLQAAPTAPTKLQILDQRLLHSYSNAPIEIPLQDESLLGAVGGEPLEEGGKLPMLSFQNIMPTPDMAEPSVEMRMAQADDKRQAYYQTKTGHQETHDELYDDGYSGWDMQVSFKRFNLDCESKRSKHTESGTYNCPRITETASRSLARKVKDKRVACSVDEDYLQAV